jgi:hypothetical protein
MIRPLRPLIAIVALAGCQQPGPVTDPFLYRSTIPPPGTALSSAPVVTPGPQPYYSTPPAVAAAPSSDTLSTPPPIVQPAPVAPAPVVPVLPPRNYPQRGGFDVPQSSNGPPPADAGAATGAVAAAGSEPAVIRIAEPPVQHITALPAVGLANPVVASGTPTNLSQAVVPASAVLPLAASSPEATGTSVNYPGDHPGVTYGYDPGYKALRGKLDYSVTARLWRLRYLPTDGPIDEYGGNVIIADGRQVNGFEPGDFVAVQGTLSPPSAATNSATYAVSRIKRQ